MPKSTIALRGVVAAVLVASGLVLAACTKDEGSSTNSSSQTSDVKIKDPQGTYKYFSDPSITKQPQKDALFGTGQTISLEYDGSKSKEEGEVLFYALYYVDTEGNVQRLTAGSFEGRTRGTFTTSDKASNYLSSGRPGFMEVSIVTNAKLSLGGGTSSSGTEVKLGMYPIKYDVSN